MRIAQPSSINCKTAKSGAEALLVTRTVAANLLSWFLTIQWANHINGYIWGPPGHPGWPDPPTWLPVSKDVYWNLNLFITAGGTAVGFLFGYLAGRIGVTTGVILISVSLGSNGLLYILSTIGTF
jgi:hypothetical protein